MTNSMKRISELGFTTRNVDAIAALTVFTIVFLTYAVVLFNTFAVLDDWSFLYNGITGQAGTVSLLIGAGRPLNAFIFDAGFSAAGSIEGLKYLRFITIIGISLLGFVLYKFSKAQKIDFITSILLAIGVVLLPSFHVYASWAQHFTTPYAGILALLSAFILTPGCRIHDRSRILAIVLSSVVLFVSLVIYQPLAMLFWTGVFISLVAAFDSGNKWSSARLFDVVISFSIAMIGAFAVFKVGQLLYPSDSSRYGLVTDVFGKLTWFISEPLANAFSLYAVPRVSSVGWLVVSIFIIAFLLLGRLRGFKVAAALVVMVVLYFLLSYVPNLATAENWGSYRSIGALAVSVFVSLLLVVRLLMKNIFHGRISSENLMPVFVAPLCLVVFFVVYLSSLSQSRVAKGFVLPNVIELNNLASFLKGQNSVVPYGGTILVKTSSWQDSSAAVLLYDEFGMHSSLRDYYSLPMVKLVLRGMGLSVDAKVLLHSDKELVDQRNVNSPITTIEFPQLVTNERFSTNLLDWKSLGMESVYPANVTDKNWAAGLWVSTDSPGFYSFTYKRRFGDAILNVGDILEFERSGFRTITRIDVGNDYSNVLVDGAPLVPGDGFPHPVRIHKRQSK